MTRLCLNRLTSQRQKREQYLGPWLPEPVATSAERSHVNPGLAAERADSLSTAFLVILETLSPAERAVFLLHSVFDYKHSEIAEILGKSGGACRQLLRRAKQHVRDRRPRYSIDTQRHQTLLRRFLEIVESGQYDQFVALLAEDVVLVPDGGGERGAATRTLHGYEAVTAFMIGSSRVTPFELDFSLINLNQQPALLAKTDAGIPYFVIFLYAQADRVELIHVIAGSKLGYLVSQLR